MKDMALHERKAQLVKELLEIDSRLSAFHKNSSKFRGWKNTRDELVQRKNRIVSELQDVKLAIRRANGPKRIEALRETEGEFEPSAAIDEILRGES